MKELEVQNKLHKNGDLNNQNAQEAQRLRSTLPTKITGYSSVQVQRKPRKATESLTDSSEIQRISGQPHTKREEGRVERQREHGVRQHDLQTDRVLYAIKKYVDDLRQEISRSNKE